MALFMRQRIALLMNSLATAGIKPLLVKGWAAAGLYPDAGVRPYADIDLCVEDSQFEPARAALNALPKDQVTVDLHLEFATLGGGDWDEIYGRARTVRLGETEVQVPSAEDHLRILAIHMLREGAWRPLWLCDVAAAVESRPDNFDWSVCVGDSRQASNWICCALKLAHELLGANISGTPAGDDANPLPQWLTTTVLKEWGAPAPSMSLRHQSPMANHLRSGTFFSGFRDRWPNAIEGTVVSGGLFNNVPRLPFQLVAYLRRGAQFALGLPKTFRTSNPPV